MLTPRVVPLRLKFGPFELDGAANRLTKLGVPIKLQPQPMRVLQLLTSRAGEVVSREEIRDCLWGESTFVDFERSINYSINQIRAALNDDPAQPRYVETLPRTGYRFIAPIEYLPQEPNNVQFPRNSSDVTPVDTPQEHQLSQHPSASRKILSSQLLIILLLGGLLLAGGVAFWLRDIPSPEHLPDLQKLEMKALTTNGRVSDAAISPNGEYLAYVQADGDKQSIWISQIGGGETQILPPQPDAILNLTFSPDGHSLYFGRHGHRPENRIVRLYRIPVLGGAPQLIVVDVDTPLTFSPNGQKIAFMRGMPPLHEYYILVANADGTGERVFAKRTAPKSFEYVGPAWSPDGRFIAAVETDNAQRWSIQVISVGDGNSRDIFTSNTSIGRLVWTPDGKGLITVLRTVLPHLGGAHPGLQINGGQMWYVDYPSGNSHRVTNDLLNYAPCCIDLTRDGSMIVDVQNAIFSDLWLVTPSASAKPVQLTSSAPVVGRPSWISNSRRLVYSTVFGEIYRLDANDGSVSLLSPHDHPATGSLSVCGDDRYIVYSSYSSIWRLKTDGSEPTALVTLNPILRGTHRDSDADCSADGKTVAYVSERSGRDEFWQISSDGGEPIPLIQEEGDAMRHSPSGRYIAYRVTEGEHHAYVVFFAQGDPARDRWIVVSKADNKRLYAWDIPEDVTYGPEWSPDERGLDYVANRNGAYNVWREPLGGGPPQQITHFTSGKIFSFSWAPDGKSLVMAYGNVRSDAVSIRNFR